MNILRYFVIIFLMFFSKESVISENVIVNNIPQNAPLIDNIAIEVTDPLDVNELTCLRKNIFFEARNQSIKGMTAVALITVNRVNNTHYPNTICDVTQQRSKVRGTSSKFVCQFSWNCDGKSDSPNLSNTAERQAWETAGIIAEKTMRGEITNFLTNATHYHASYVQPTWSTSPRMKKIATVDSHIFYRDVAIANSIVTRI